MHMHMHMHMQTNRHMCMHMCVRLLTRGTSRAPAFDTPARLILHLQTSPSLGHVSPCCCVQVAAGALNFVLGFGAVTTSYTMQLIPKTQATQAVLVHFFRLCPPFLLGEGLIELTRVQFTRSLIAVAGSGPSATCDKASICASD